jgi:hypothetical protein
MNSVQSSSKSVAVITDVTSTGFFFPIWKRYYGGIFGSENLFLLTYRGLKAQFKDVDVGNVWELNSLYNDSVRAKAVTHFVSLLLESYDVVIRCDVDEFLFPPLSLYAGLADFIEKNTLPYVTAIGIDLVEMPGEPELDLNSQILIKQRKMGILSSPLHKTSVTTVPIVWAAGFHAANVFPRFSNLYNIHLKFADIAGRTKWNRFMQESLASESKEYSYFVSSSQHLENHQARYAGLPIVNLLSDRLVSEFQTEFLNSVGYGPAHRVYQGHFNSSRFLVELGAEFDGTL